MYANARGLQSKRCSLKDIMEERQPEIILLTETQLKSNTGVRFEGYTFFGKNRDDNGGGVGIFVRNDIKGQCSPYYSDKELEILWISIRQKNMRPIYMGTYYGKQESRTNKEEMEHEMDLLSEEIEQIKQDGEILLLMDGNGKLGLMGEKPSRNGKMLLEVFQDTDLCLLNKSEKCIGTVTRQNTKNQNEKSAIDFVLSTRSFEPNIQEVRIDEDGHFRLRGKKDSDHNTILVKVNIQTGTSSSHAPNKRWRLKAPEEKWAEFREKLEKVVQRTKNLSEENASNQYDSWIKTINKCAKDTIGLKKKISTSIIVSSEVKELRKERRESKKNFEMSQPDERENLKQIYIQKQTEVRNQIQKEAKERAQKRFEEIIQSKNRDLFWKERKTQMRNDSSEWLVTKDETGKRLHDPKENLENVATYYENLYRPPQSRHHPYHDTVQDNIKKFGMDMTYDNELYNLEPGMDETRKAIAKKKNGKATTDLCHEILKGGAEPMIEMVHHWIQKFWQEEKPPSQWNEGILTTLWKGKGDREILSNHRGITVSSSISMVAEQLLNNRVESLMEFTQAQGGGQKGFSTADHVFCLRSVIMISLKLKKPTFLTFYDVKKAYDHADLYDMLNILWEKGVCGKTWRLIKALNENLTAKVKTKHGLTRKIQREKGGKQGGVLIVKMFSKLIDMVAEETLENPELGVNISGEKIGPFLWVDDVVTIAEGQEQQEKTLKHIDDFACRHQLEWGLNKCNVMEVGRHRNPKVAWQFGETEIHHNDSYTYLGDVITRNGTNQLNIESRLKKVKAATRAIISCSKTDVLKLMEVDTLLGLHETVTIPSLLTNAESWCLTKTEILNLEKIELWAIKRLFNLPRTTPSVAIRFMTQRLLTSVRIDIKQMMFLYRILQQEERWTYNLLNTMDKMNLGWAANIRLKLHEYGLTQSWNEIQKKGKTAWKAEVYVAAEKLNKQKLLEDCYGTKNGCREAKTKTKMIVKELECNTYDRKKTEHLLKLTRSEMKCIIMARYGMLMCGKNFKTKFGTDQCKTCSVLDDENHRLNSCIRWRKSNWHDVDNNVDFNLVYSNDIEILKTISKHILKVWSLKYGSNDMLNRE